MIVFNISFRMDQTALEHGSYHTAHSGHPRPVASHQAVKYKIECGWLA
ncbi:MAG: hypothetical protein R3C56_38445 [Pirellulaceae bacterium]